MDEHTDDALKTHNEYGFWTLLVRRPGSISDRVLCLHGEEEAAGEGVYVAKAGFEVLVLFRGVQVPVGEDDEPPEESEE